MGLYYFFLSLFTQVCATLGTTGSCSFDNLLELGVVCRRESMGENNYEILPAFIILQMFLQRYFPTAFMPGFCNKCRQRNDTFLWLDYRSLVTRGCGVRWKCVHLSRIPSLAGRGWACQLPGVQSIKMAHGSLWLHRHVGSGFWSAA